MNGGKPIPGTALALCNAWALAMIAAARHGFMSWFGFTVLVMSTIALIPWGKRLR